MLSKSAKDDLRQIISKDYGQNITDDQAEELGVTLLRLTRVGLSVLARDLDKKKSVDK